MVEAEEEADVVGGYLQQGHLVLLAALEGGARLCVEPQQRLAEEIVDGFFRLSRRENDDDSSLKLRYRKCGDESFIVFVVDNFGHLFSF